MDRDTPRHLADHLWSGLSLLTRLPVPDHRPAGAEAAWTWPLVGLILGLLAAALAATLLALGLPPGPAAAATLVGLALLSGAIHEDGLADTADGLLGGRTPERRLAIMKDSRIGSFGALALMLVTLAAWSALSALMAQGTQTAALIVACALSRAPMAVLMAALPPARPSGLSAATGRPSPRIAALAALIAALIALVLLAGRAFAPMLAALLLSSLLAVTARRLIGGQTGDILGCAQQLCFAAILSLLA